jgi:excisionase family DNA binding protein
MRKYMAKTTRRQARGLIAVGRAASLLKIDRQNVYEAIWRGAIRAKKVKGRWRLPLHEVQRYLEKRRRHGF